MGDRAKGLVGKFHVERTDGKSAAGEKHDGCEYFVLDLTHDPHAIPALAAYARSARAGGYALLADDLERIVAASPAGADSGPTLDDAFDQVSRTLQHQDFCYGDKGPDGETCNCGVTKARLALATIRASHPAQSAPRPREEILAAMQRAEVTTRFLAEHLPEYARDKQQARTDKNYVRQWGDLTMVEDIILWWETCIRSSALRAFPPSAGAGPEATWKPIADALVWTKCYGHMTTEERYEAARVLYERGLRASPVPPGDAP